MHMERFQWIWKGDVASTWFGSQDGTPRHQHAKDLRIKRYQAVDKRMHKQRIFNS